MPYKILAVSHYYAAHGGGVERVAARLIREIDEGYNCFRFTWAASDCTAPPDLRGHALLPMRSFNFLEKAFGLPWPLWSPGSHKRLTKAVAAADVVWLHDTLYPGTLAAFQAAQKLKKRIVITQHIGPIPYSNIFWRQTMLGADKAMTVPMLKAAHETVFISDRVAEEYCRRVRFTKPIRVIQNGADLKPFQAPLPEKRRYLRLQFALKAEQPVLLFVGRFVNRKGLPVLRRMAEQLPEARFWLAGQGPINPVDWQLPNVHVFRDREGESLAELYQAADLLILPSYGEGFPLVIQEALACGLPVMCSPETGAGNRAALPYLHLANVWPDNPRLTAAVWIEKLEHFPFRLPLDRPQYDLAELAQSLWSWAPIADAYASIFYNLCCKGT
ncbi:MAG: glycosyltransferase family 4 protein [Alphaproteobacteria bacterium]|nr:glycosyltransferase family 4 protein [Alphaproteobacteria bacterium]